MFLKDIECPLGGRREFFASSFGKRQAAEQNNDHGAVPDTTITFSLFYVKRLAELVLCSEGFGA